MFRGLLTEHAKIAEVQYLTQQSRQKNLTKIQKLHVTHVKLHENMRFNGIATEMTNQLTLILDSTFGFKRP